MEDVHHSGSSNLRVSEFWGGCGQQLYIPWMHMEAHSSYALQLSWMTMMVMGGSKLAKRNAGVKTIFPGVVAAFHKSGNSWHENDMYRFADVAPRAVITDAH